MIVTNIEKDEYFEIDDIKLRTSMREAKEKGAYISYRNQDSSKDNPDEKSDFCHVSVNMPLSSNDIKVRLYLSPTQKNLHQMVVELVNWALSKGKNIKFKYALTSNRVDQLVIYLKDQDDINEKLEILKNLSNRRPELFEKSQRCASWVFGTDVDSVYLAPEPQLTDYLGRQTSYSAALIKALSNTKAILEYNFNVEKDQDLSQYVNTSSFKTIFKADFEEMLKRQGIFMKKNENTGRYEIIYRDVKQTFNYDREKRELCEMRLIDNCQNDFYYNQLQKDAFFEYLLSDSQLIEHNKRK